MRLKEWRIKQEISQAELAKDLAVTQQIISRWESQKNRPEFETMLRIEEYTKGKVKLDDWR